MRYCTPRVRAAGWAVLPILLAASSLWSQTTTVILVRHAEKAAAPAADPPLTPTGEARARDLWDAVKDAGVDAIITTHFLRARATAQPTASALGLTSQVADTGVAAAIMKHAGHTVLVVGHSNTVPSIIEALGAKKPAEVCDSEFDNMYVVTLAADGKAGVVRSRFGVPTPAGACTGIK